MRLILASKSARRALLLREAGYVFEVATPLFDDPANPVQLDGHSPQQVAMDLAARKALSIDLGGGRFSGRDSDATDAVILAADTICVGSDGALIGTPATAEAAGQMIQAFVNSAHQVVSGVALRRGGQVETLADSAEVVFGPLELQQIADYLAGGLWQGKAGGYNLFERQAAGWPISVQGDPTTVVGLPMKKLTVALARWGISAA
ncbi:MAG: Maf family protein [Phycisphaeraceae bacterium]|nr:Maf family protein [Phycisphaeraceae bacterium]